MTVTYNLISSASVPSGGQNTVTFDNIPQTYTDLKIVWSAQNDRSDGNWGYMKAAFNSNTSLFTHFEIYASGGFGSETTYVDTNNYASYMVATAWMGTNVFGNGSMYISDYTNSGAHKTYLLEDTSANTTTNGIGIGMFIGTWASNSSITSISLSCDTGRKFNQYSNFYLYGIKKA